MCVPGDLGSQGGILKQIENERFDADARKRVGDRECQVQVQATALTYHFGLPTSFAPFNRYAARPPSNLTRGSQFQALALPPSRLQR
jgi:hypothetical protein